MHGIIYFGWLCGHRPRDPVAIRAPLELSRALTNYVGERLRQLPKAQQPQLQLSSQTNAAMSTAGHLRWHAAGYGRILRVADLRFGAGNTHLSLTSQRARARQ